MVEKIRKTNKVREKRASKKRPNYAAVTNCQLETYEQKSLNR